MIQCVQAVIALGSNLGEPEKQVLSAIDRLSEAEGVELIKASSLYITKPVGYLDQPDFVNAVVLVNTTIPAPELMTLLLEIEQEFGRERSFANAPRKLDLDLIDYHAEVWNTPHLTLPHPRAQERGFVIFPLAEIAPDYILGDKGVVHELAEQLSEEGVARL